MSHGHQEGTHSHNAAIYLFDQAIRETLGRLPKGSKIVDMGAGNGGTTRLFRELGYQNIELVDVENHLDQEIAKLGRALRFKFLLPNGALFSSKTLYILRKPAVS